METRTDSPVKGLENVLRAMTSFEADVDKYTRIDIEDAILLAADDSTPLTKRIRREAKALTTKHEWLEQYLPAIGTNVQMEGKDPTASAANKPLRFSNTMQIMSRSFDITDTMERIARAGGLVGVQGSELARQMAMQITLLFQEQEYYLLNGVEHTPEDALLGREMKGLLAWILAANKKDALAVEITPLNVKSYLNKTIAKIIAQKGGVRPNAIYCGPVFADVLAEAAGSGVQVTVDLATYKNAAPQGVVGSNVGWFKSNYGILEVVMTPFLPVAEIVGDAADSHVLLVHEPSLSIVDYKNNSGIEIAERAKSDAFTRKVATEEITLEVQNFRAHGDLHNFFVTV